MQHKHYKAYGEAEGKPPHELAFVPEINTHIENIIKTEA